jgi:IS1 family transposase
MLPVGANATLRSHLKNIDRKKMTVFHRFFITKYSGMLKL